MMAGNGLNSTVGTMQRTFKLASQAGEPSLDHWRFASQAAMALTVIVLLTPRLLLWKYFYRAMKA